MALFVGRLPIDIRQRELEDLFYKFGRITRCDAKRGYGFVEFEDRRDAEDALRATDGMRFCGTRIIVEWAKGTRDRSDRDRGSRSNECFKCHREGHWARECPNSGSSSGDGDDFGRRRGRSRSRSTERSSRRSRSPSGNARERSPPQRQDSPPHRRSDSPVQVE